MALRILPSASINLGSTAIWVVQNAGKITVETLLLTVSPRVDILQRLLYRVRERTRKLKYVKVSRIDSPDAKYRQESSYRAEVRDWPDKFNFAAASLEEYHPVHLAEMIVILLELLDRQGVDARVSTPVPQVPVV